MPRTLQFEQHLADDLCEWLANGGSMRAWCELDGHPTFSTVFKWLGRVETFAEQYAYAREIQAHNDGDRMNTIAEELREGTIDPNAARVMADILKWTAGKRLPKSYGDKVQLSGDDTGAPIIVTWATGEKLNN